MVQILIIGGLRFSNWLKSRSRLGKNDDWMKVSRSDDEEQRQL